MHHLPGTFRITRGRAADYRALAPYHYLAKAPATWAGIWVVRYRPARPTRARSRVVAVAVLSWPVPSSFPREAALGRLGRFDRSANLRFANRHIRTISRVIVHPQFRSLGLASALIRWVCQRCNTRYVEAFAVMGRAHPMFERAGMTRVRRTTRVCTQPQHRRPRRVTDPFTTSTTDEGDDHEIRTPSLFDEAATLHPCPA